MGMRLDGRTGFLAGAGILGGVLFLVAVELEAFHLRLGTKAIPIVCLLLWMWPPRERYARLICVGLVLSLVGDLLLEVDSSLFLPGLGAFLCAHVAYVAAYLMVTRVPSLTRGVPFALLGVGATVFLWPGLGGLALPVTAYVVVICTMAWRSAAMVGAEGLARREQWLALAGALMFAASDGLLAIKLFVQPVAGGSYAIMLLYWAGQLCIALSAREPTETARALVPG
ncbi:lysoplasmalogenase [Hyalangium gracile]|uniref:lysoplasmalogenase n=1 Tax=Hyalangium gracile TaxID=394092 RepID=UPI001CCAE8D5|nr:lysoplasmalogenase [Hyalangium gracile]